MRYSLVILLCLASTLLAQQKPKTITPRVVKNDTTTAQLSVKDQIAIIEQRQAAIKLEFEKDFSRLEGMKQILQQIAADSIKIKTQ